jgi:hypothetical protein
MLIRATFESSDGARGTANFVCESTYDFDFIVTSDPFVKLVDFKKITWIEAIMSNHKLIDATEYRQECELVEHNRYPLSEICNAQEAGE